jgi:hypothetical protein
MVNGLAYFEVSAQQMLGNNDDGTIDLRAAASLMPSTFRTTESRWYCNSAHTTARSSPRRYGGF